MNPVFLLLIAALALPETVYADHGAISVREAIEQTFKRNHILQATVHQRTAAERMVSVQRSRYLPRIFLDESAAISNSPTKTFMMKLDEGRFSQSDFLIDNLNHPASRGDFRTSFNLEMPLFDAGIGPTVQLAEQELATRDLSLQRRRQELAFEVYSEFLEIRRAKALLSSAEQAVSNAREHHRLAVARSAAGTGLKSDELRARTFLAEAEQQRITALNDLKVAKLRLASTMGGEIGASYEIADDIKPLPVTETGEELVQLALRSRTDLKEAQEEVNKSDSGIQLARSAYMPTVHGNVAYQMNDRDIPFGRDNDSWMAGVALRWDLFDGQRRSNEVARASALRSASASTLESRRREVALQVTESLFRREEASRRLEVAQHAVRDAEETVRLIAKRFQNSLATMAELLDAQTSLDRARAQLVGNEADYAQATARLLGATGIFLQEVMK